VPVEKVPPEGNKVTDVIAAVEPKRIVPKKV
jgi:hypothetical protein